MARNKTINEKIAAAKKEIKDHEDQLNLLLQAQKEQERKARTKRFCRRCGQLEKILPDTITLTEDQFDLFLDKTLLTDFTRRTLAAIKSGQLKPAEKPAEAAQTGNTDTSKTEGDVTRQGA